jgi:hypothetical protein
MTTEPVVPEPVKPSKAKSLVALLGSLLAVAIPLLVQVSGYLPPPWPAVIGGVIALLTWLGVYEAPYKPKDTVLVSTDDVAVVHPAPPPPPSGYKKPPGWGG